MKISRKTKTLKIVLDLFEKQDNAYSVVELVSIFSKKMNKTTVYRILERLEDSGLLHSFLDKNGLKTTTNLIKLKSNGELIFPNKMNIE